MRLVMYRDDVRTGIGAGQRGDLHGLPMIDLRCPGDLLALIAAGPQALAAAYVWRAEPAVDGTAIGYLPLVQHLARSSVSA